MMTVIDDYLEKIETGKRKEPERIRRIAKKTVPEAEETISYGMPTFKYQGKAFLGFDIHSKHIGIYPFSGEVVEKFKDQLDRLGYGYSAGTIRVPPDKPIPENLLVAIIRHRIGRIK